MLGTDVGIVSTQFAGEGRGVPLQYRSAGPALPLALIGLWLAAELLPCIPLFDLQSIKSNLAALSRHLTVVPEELAFHAVGTILSGWALAAILGIRRSIPWLLVVASLVTAGKALTVTPGLNVSTLFGVGLGWTAWLLLARWHEPRRSTAVMLLLLGAYAVGALLPFELRNSPAPFNLVPFAQFQYGSMLLHVQALVAELCLLTGILAVIRLNGGATVPSSVGLAVLVLTFQAIDMYLAGHTADITVPLLVLVIGQILRFVPETLWTRRVEGKPTKLHEQTTRLTPLVPTPAAHFSPIGLLVSLALVTLMIGFAVDAVLQLPQVPHYVVELFLGGGAFPFLVVFALALLWAGAGAHWVGHSVARSSRPYLALPLLAFAAAIVSVLLLCGSVTQQALADVTDSHNLQWFARDKDIWGDWARRLILDTPQGMLLILERFVRYCALYAPIVTVPALIFAGIEMCQHDRIGARRIVLLGLSAFLWLWLCKVIAFDWSSVYRLRELLASNGPWGWGGGTYLYAMLVLISAIIALFATMPLTVAWGTIAVGATLVSLPIGWWLLNLGLEQRAQQPTHALAAAQFLLGPDPKHLLSPEVLFSRWSAVQMAGMFVIAAGARLARSITRRPA